MMLYLDDDTASALLAKLLRQVGHDVQIPADVNMAGESDPLHLTHAIGDGRVCVTKNHDDFLVLHNLIKQAQGHHLGIFVVSPKTTTQREIDAQGHCDRIRKLEAAGVPIQDEFIVLNHWR